MCRAARAAHAPVVWGPGRTHAGTAAATGLGVHAGLSRELGSLVSRQPCAQLLSLGDWEQIDDPAEHALTYTITHAERACGHDQPTAAHTTRCHATTARAAMRRRTSLHTHALSPLHAPATSPPVAALIHTPHASARLLRRKAAQYAPSTAPLGS